jgi:uncharacterized protein DUF5615
MRWTPISLASGRAATQGEIDEVERGARLKNHRARFYADENLRQPVVRYLRTRGLVIQTAAEVGLRRRSDEDQVAHAWRERRVLLTEDRDFLNPRRFPIVKMPATIVFDFGDGSDGAVLAALTPLGFVWRFPDLYDKWVRIHAHTEHWTEEVRLLDGTSGRTRMRFHHGRVEWWIDEPSPVSGRQ